MKNQSMLALQQIESVIDAESCRIVPIHYHQGTAMPLKDVMEAKVDWVLRIGYSVLAKSVPREFSPFNAIIRVNGANTEDRNLDYLAQFGEPAVPEDLARGGRTSSPVTSVTLPEDDASTHPTTVQLRKRASESLLSAGLLAGDGEHDKARHVSRRGAPRR